MKRFCSSRQFAACGAVILCAVLVYLVFSQSSDPEDPGGTRNPFHADDASTKPPRIQQMPDGMQRPLAVRIPAVGRVTGARWIPGHEFQAKPPKRYSKGPLNNVLLDVLVNADGHFLAARRGNTRFDTRMPDAAMIRLLQYAIYGEYDRRQQRLTGPILPEITRVSMTKVPWDDPELGDAMKWLMNWDYQGLHGREEPEDILQRFEDTYYYFEVQFEGEPTPRQISVRRMTEGRVWLNGRVPRTYPALPEPYICNTNINGAGVIYVVREHPPKDRGWPERYYLALTEPWDGPSPWPEDRLDPNVGRDRLNEFLFPDEAPAGQMPDILNLTNPYPLGADKPFVERAAANKAARLAQEASPEGGPR